MTILGLSDMTWIGIIAFLACLIVGIILIKTKKPGIVRSVRDKNMYKNPEEYAVRGGKLFLYLSGGCLVMLILSFVNIVVSNVFGLICICVFGFFWKKMSDEFGPV